MDGDKKVGIIRMQGMGWQLGTHNGAEYPERWVILIPTFSVEPNSRMNYVGVNKVIAEKKKILG